MGGRNRECTVLRKYNVLFSFQSSVAQVLVRSVHWIALEVCVDQEVRTCVVADSWCLAWVSLEELSQVCMTSFLPLSES